MASRLFKLLHTADWHLGHRFVDQERTREHQMALDWLLHTLSERESDLLIVAGDVFDTTNPGNTSRQQYYDFLLRLRDTACRHVVVIGGNHDSPGMLDAPKALLSQMGIHVHGAVAASPQEQLIELRDTEGQLEAVVAAVPFLRSQDIRYAVAGETGEQRIQRIQEGIRQHYAAVGKALAAYVDAGVPLIGTGHLHASGALASEGQTAIYLSNHDNIAASDFPAEMDYVALGHLHRAQALGDYHHIRYAGSLLPMNFTDAAIPRTVTEVNFEGRTISQGIKLIEMPAFRAIRRVEGKLAEVEEVLQAEAIATSERELRTWIEAVVHTSERIPGLYTYLQAFVQDMSLSLLKIQEMRAWESEADVFEAEEQLHQLSVLDVFEKKCRSAGVGQDQMPQLKEAFLELQDWMRDMSQSE